MNLGQNPTTTMHDRLLNEVTRILHVQATNWKIMGIKNSYCRTFKLEMMARGRGGGLVRGKLHRKLSLLGFRGMKRSSLVFTSFR